jgi:hypothetical protein
MFQALGIVTIAIRRGLRPRCFYDSVLCMVGCDSLQVILASESLVVDGLAARVKATLPFKPPGAPSLSSSTGFAGTSVGERGARWHHLLGQSSSHHPRSVFWHPVLLLI